MTDSNKAINSGVHNAIGIEFQKHCALYLLLVQFHNLKDKKYFICIEHLDDFLFCYENENGLISSVEAYQSKKSSDKWSINETFYEILSKAIKMGADLRKDEIIKTQDYLHTLHFITNNTIELKVKDKTTKREHITRINESNANVKYIDLDLPIKDKIEEGVKKYLDQGLIQIPELNNVSLFYIDFGKNRDSQKLHLVGLFNKVFGLTVIDHRAAIDVLIELFRDIETQLNQGNIARLLDKSKRVDSSTINEAIKIITTKQKAYELWRSQKNDLAKRLNISIMNQKKFEFDFQNSLDLFKDLKQVEHQKILNFVERNHDVFKYYVDEVDCIDNLYKKFCQETTTQLDEIQAKATIYAAYIQLKEGLGQQN